MADGRFEQALKNALARYNKQTAEEEYDEIPEMSAAFLARMDDRVRRGEPKREGFVMTKDVKKWKKAWTAAICAAAVLAGSVCVYATVPAVRDYINMLFLKEDSGTRLTEVPEGWVGIYSADDLETIREDMYGSYILMNDIAIPDEYYEAGGIYENGFTPIGGGDVPYTVVDENGKERQFWQDTAFRGTFNGNGYVISNLHIRNICGLDNVYSGFFGKCNFTAGDPLRDPETNEPYRQFTGGIIKNLGIVNSSVEVTITEGSPVYAPQSVINIGMIAGECDVVAGCFTENVSVTLTFAEDVEELSIGSLKIGGVAGETIITDSCWSDADVTVINNGPAVLNTPYVAGVTGFTGSCVTSYFNGTIQCAEADYGVAGFDSTTPPTLLSDTVMAELKERFLAVGDEWNAVKLASFYTYCRADEMQMYITKDLSETGRYFYLIDPLTKERERKELSGIIATIFTGDEFMEFCQENDVKYGTYNNYDLRDTADCSFEGFDFTYIWNKGNDGLPKLRLFGYAG